MAIYTVFKIIILGRLDEERTSIYRKPQKYFLKSYIKISEIEIISEA